MAEAAIEIEIDVAAAIAEANGARVPAPAATFTAMVDKQSADLMRSVASFKSAMAQVRNDIKAVEDHVQHEAECLVARNTAFGEYATSAYATMKNIGTAMAELQKQGLRVIQGGGV